MPLIRIRTRYLLRVLTGICWTVTYLLIIYVGFRDKTYGMPMLALFANLAWEYIFSFNKHHSKVQTFINRVWFAFDLIILYQFFAYAHFSFVNTYPRYVFYILASLLFTPTYLLVRKAITDHDPKGIQVTFLQTLLMSILFIYMFFTRGGHAGQSIYIAVFKLFGDAFGSVDNYLRDRNIWHLNVIYMAILIFDLLYILLLAVY